MGLIRYVIPALLLLYFVARSARQRVFLLGVPFLMFMASSVFFDHLKIFYIPGRLDPADHLMIWLIVVWLFSFDLFLPVRLRGEHRAPLFGPRLSPLEEIVLLGLAALAILEFALTVLQFGDLGGTLSQAKGWIYLFAGYFLLRGMLCRASRRDTLDFIKALVLVNTLAAMLFILHQGLHVSVYVGLEYETLTFMGHTITRTFYFMPQFLILAIAYTIARRTWSALWLGVFFITLAALWVSYTRSLLFIAALEVVAVLGVHLMRSGQADFALRRFLAIVLVAAIFVFGALVVLPVQSSYLASRLGIGVSSTSATSESTGHNLLVRADSLKSVNRWISAEGKALGTGFKAQALDPRSTTVDGLSSDQIWVPVLYRLGYAGVAVIAALFAAAVWRALRLGLTGTGDAELMGTMLFALMLGVFLQGFVSWTLLDPGRYPMGLWFFALLTAEACRRRAESWQEVADA